MILMYMFIGLNLDLIHKKNMAHLLRRIYHRGTPTQRRKISCVPYLLEFDGQIIIPIFATLKTYFFWFTVIHSIMETFLMGI